jgi:hypothetical protein
MVKGFAKPPKKYPANGRWFSSYNWENGFYGTLDQCLDHIQHCFPGEEFVAASLLTAGLEAHAGDEDPRVGQLKSFWEHKEKEAIQEERGKIRDKCLREGEAKSATLSNWYICFKGKRGDS